MLVRSSFLAVMCSPIRVQAIRKKCDAVADDFALQLVDVLSSQMDPDVVCSVAGLCNSVEIDRLLAIEAMTTTTIVTKPAGMSCGQCNKISGIISQKFNKMDRDQVLEQMLMACRGMSSYSDGCSAIVLSYFNDIYRHLKSNLNAENLCHMSGTCSFRFHQHDDDNDKDVQVVVDSQIGVIDHSKGDDIPCDLCKQLVVHLRYGRLAGITKLFRFFLPFKKCMKVFRFSCGFFLVQ